MKSGFLSAVPGWCATAQSLNFSAVLNRRILRRSQRNLTMLCGDETADSAVGENELQNLGHLMLPILDIGQLTLPKVI
jgi:hypothetical protein